MLQWFVLLNKSNYLINHWFGVFVSDSVFGDDDLKVHQFSFAVGDGAADGNHVVSATELYTDMEGFFLFVFVDGFLKNVFDGFEGIGSSEGS